MLEPTLYASYEVAAGAHAAENANAPQRRASPVPHVESRRLLSGCNELVIEHAGQEYRLRLTRNDKLILTK